MQRKTNILPLDIHQLIFDIRSLDASERGHYLTLLAHYWEYGSTGLPNDLDYIASVAGVRGDARSILKPCLKRLFHVEKDGRLHSRQWGFRFRSERDKAKKRQVKARHAANTRWDRVRESRRIECEGQMTCLEHSETANLVPSPVSPSFPPRTPLVTPLPSPSVGDVSPYPSEAQELRSAVPIRPEPEVPETAEGESKAKTAARASWALRKDGVRESSVAGGEIGVAAAPDAKNGRWNHRARRRNVLSGEDARFEPCRELIFGYWQRVNSGLKICPWGPGERRALRDLLEVNPLISVEHFGRCLKNRELSKGVNPAAIPGDWLRRVVMYGEGPLNEYDKLVRAVSPVQAGVYREPTKQEVATMNEQKRLDVEHRRMMYRDGSELLKKILRDAGWNREEDGPAPWDGDYGEK
jgi:uncharacterized protein YdaU (DUF1376 family)